MKKFNETASMFDGLESLPERWRAVRWICKERNAATEKGDIPWSLLLAMKLNSPNEFQSLDDDFSELERNAIRYFAITAILARGDAASPLPAKSPRKKNPIKGAK